MDSRDVGANDSSSGPAVEFGSAELAESVEPKDRRQRRSSSETPKRIRATGCDQSERKADADPEQPWIDPRPGVPERIAGRIDDWSRALRIRDALIVHV